MQSARFLVLVVLIGLGASGLGCKADDGGGAGTGATGGASGVSASGGVGGTAGMMASGGVGDMAGMMASGGVGGMAGMMASGGVGGVAGMMASGGVGGMMASGGVGGMDMQDAGPSELTFTSMAFEDGDQIPMANQCVMLSGGAGASPDFAWSGAPAGTMSFAITLTDMTTTGLSVGYIHWTIYDIPGGATSLPGGVEKTAMPTMPAGVMAGTKQSEDNQSALVPGPGYFGPCGSAGTNNPYQFKLWALDVATLPDVTTATPPAMIRAQIMEHEIASATLDILSQR